jgi:hypothetical protein
MLGTPEIHQVHFKRGWEGWEKIFVFFNPPFLNDSEQGCGIKLVSESGTNVVLLLNSGTENFFYCFVLLEMYQLHFPFQIKSTTPFVLGGR